MAERGTAGAAPAVDVTWRSRQRPRRGPRPSLSVDQIVAAALELADAEGIEAVSMQRVARALGFTTMSLYRYVTGKEQLVEAMLDTALGEPPPVDADEPWDARVHRWVAALWDAYQRHPWILRTVRSGPPLGPNELAWFDTSLRSFDGSGLTDDERMALALFVSSSVRGLAAATADHERRLEAAGQEVTYGEALRALLDPQRHPALWELATAGAFDAVETDEGGADLALGFGVTHVVAGVRAYVAARANDPDGGQVGTHGG